MRAKRIAGVLLAAGESRRFGRPKQLLPWKGRSLIEHVVQTAVKAGLDPVVVVIGADADEMRAAIRSSVTVVENADWTEGMSTSLRAGLRALPDDVNAAIILLADQPRIEPDHLAEMIDTYRKTGKPIVGSAFKGRRASPTLFDRTLFDRLMQITGDHGGRSIIRANPDLVALVEAKSKRDLMDIDTIADWQRMSDG